MVERHNSEGLGLVGLTIASIGFTFLLIGGSMVLRSIPPRYDAIQLSEQRFRQQLEIDKKAEVKIHTQSEIEEMENNFLHRLWSVNFYNITDMAPDSVKANFPEGSELYVSEIDYPIWFNSIYGDSHLSGNIHDMW